MNIKYQVTQDSISVLVDGKPHVVQRGTPNFEPLRKALLTDQLDQVSKYLTVAKAISEWAKGEFTIEGNTVSYKGQALPYELNQRIVEMASRGDDPTAVMNFWEKLQKNPSYNSVQQLWRFLQANLKGHPLQPDGRFLAYKGVRQDYLDQYSGKFLNKPGVVLKMPRNQVSDDYNVDCHEGFHVGAIGYATGFAARTMIVIVDPEHVVSVPLDHHSQKMRVCEYEVKGNSNGEILPEGVFTDDPEPESFDSTDGLDDEDEPECADREDLEACMEAGAHLVSCDDDGYCNNCGEQVHPGEARVVDLMAKEADEGVKVAKVNLKIVKPAPEKKPIKGWAKFNKMPMKELMEQSIEDLRQYASKGLEIVGSSKIPGGKTALVSRILKVRS